MLHGFVILQVVFCSCVHRKQCLSIQFLVFYIEYNVNLIALGMCLSELT